MSLNRTIAPSTRLITSLEFPEFTRVTSNSGVPVCFVHDDNLDVLKIEFVFEAGARNQSSLFQAQAAISMLSEGTPQRTAAAIADELDFYGSYVQPRYGIDESSLFLYCLPRFLKPCLEVVFDLLTNSNYPDYELITLKQNAIQRLKINESRNSFLARRGYYAAVFGSENCYGSSVYQGVIENISRETLEQFFLSSIKGRLRQVYVSGNTTASEPEILGFCNGFSVVQKSEMVIPTLQSDQPYHYIERKQSVQNAIRIGRKTINRKDSDFRKLQFLNLLLGGYFGSRLMTNIREEKGLTYGIHSAIETYRDTASFYIETEINKELTHVGRQEIENELKKLQELPIGAEELETARNYMTGGFIRSFDGVFAITDRIKIILDNDLPLTYYSEFIEIIQGITPLELQDLANKYLRFDGMVTIVAGQE